MKIIEALKLVKLNEKKIADFADRIKVNSAKLSNQNSPYKNPTEQVKAWEQSILDLVKNNEELQLKIHKTNTVTNITVVVDGKAKTKTIDEWLYRVKNGVRLESMAYAAMTNRGLKESADKDKDGNLIINHIEYAYDAEHKDRKVMSLTEEIAAIHTALEIANAVTDIVEG